MAKTAAAALGVEQLEGAEAPRSVPARPPLCRTKDSTLAQILSSVARVETVGGGAHFVLAGGAVADGSAGLQEAVGGVGERGRPRR